MSSTATLADYGHIPVLPRRTVELLTGERQGACRIIDGTLGCGGHSALLLKRLPEAVLLGIDRDGDALKRAGRILSFAKERVRLVQSDFASIRTVAEEVSWSDGVDLILLDLGVSSPQIDDPERGFSFRFDAPLDMRMNRLAEKNAAGIVNGYSKEELIRIFRLYGELEGASRAAELICREREKRRISTTGDLSRCLSPIHNNRNEHKFLAKLYQALRIEVNGEMDSLEGFLNGVLQILKPGGILSVITYHSLEDRMVKNFIKSGNIDGKIEKDIYGNAEGPFIAITRKPIIPSSGEIAANSRSRSAKLRVAKRRE